MRPGTKPLQGPIAPAVPFPPGTINPYASQQQPGFDFVFTESGGHLAVIGGPVETTPLQLSVPADLVKRRFYIYFFVSADSAQVVEASPTIDLYFQNYLVGKIPLSFRNTASALTFSKTSTPNFSGNFEFTTQAADNPITLNLLNRIGDAELPGFHPGETTDQVLIRPYEMDLRIDTVKVAPFQFTTSAGGNPYTGARLWLGVLSLHP